MKAKAAFQKLWLVVLPLACWALPTTSASGHVADFVLMFQAGIGTGFALFSWADGTFWRVQK